MRHFEINYSKGQHSIGREVSKVDLPSSLRRGPVVFLTDKELEEIQTLGEAELQQKLADAESDWWDQYQSSSNILTFLRLLNS